MPPSCTINSTRNRILTKRLGEEFNVNWASANADYLISSGWSGPVDCGKGNATYDSSPYKCRNDFLGGGHVGKSLGWGPLYMREPGRATVTLTPKRYDGAAGLACSIQVVASQIRSKFSLGDRVKVIPTTSGVSQVNVRGLDPCGRVIAKKYKGDTGVISRADSIKCGDPFYWMRWRVKFDDGTEGWVVEWRLGPAGTGIIKNEPALAETLTGLKSALENLKNMLVR